MAKLFDIAEGWTGRLGPFTISAKLPGESLAPLPIDPLYTVTFGWRKGTSDWEEAPGTVEPDADQVANPGQFDYLPLGASDFTVPDELVKQIYFVRAVVEDSQGRIITVPNGASAEIVVYRK